MTLAPTRTDLPPLTATFGDSVITVDPEGFITSINPAAESFSGWLEHEAVGKPIGKVIQLIHAHPLRGIDALTKAVLEKENSIEFGQPAIVVTKDASRRPVSGYIQRIKDKQSKCLGVLIVIQDLREQQAREWDRQKAGKFESLGLLASGIAHDFNNLLAAIIGNISLVRFLVHSDDPALARLAETEKASIRAQSLTKQLLHFAKGTTGKQSPCHIKRLLIEAAEFALCGSIIRCRFHIPDDLWLVNMDESQFGQIIHNLVINAQQAMPQGGHITISASNESIPLEGASSSQKDDYVKVTITDTGIGIGPENLPKIFDPYFTTKERGSGLGLAVTETIIRNHRGLTSVESTVGQGTTFSIFLPAIRQTFPEKKEWVGSPTKGKGRILVMDDEEAILDMVRQMLTSCGYESEVAHDGNEVMEHIHRATEMNRPFAACILDLTIPNGMGGQETLQRLRSYDPQIKVIVSSGYVNDPVFTDFSAFGFADALPKPYTVSQLSRVLNRVLTVQSSLAP